jgi:cyclic beta-1,2-glucan synthetase
MKAWCLPLARCVRRRERPTLPWASLDPVREELFSVERIEQHARSLAAAQTVAPSRIKGLPLAGRLADNAAVLRASHRAIAAAADAGGAITPAAE